MPIGAMMAGHGQLDDQQLCKRIRCHLVANKTARAAELDEEASVLRTEINNLENMDDQSVLHEYGAAFLDLESQASAPNQTPGMEICFHEPIEADHELPPTQLLGTMDDSDVHPYGKIEEDLEAEYDNVGLKTVQLSAGCEVDIDQMNLDQIQDVLKQTEFIEVSEADSADFQALCKNAYDKSITEEGMDVDEKAGILERAAMTGDFDVQGGLIGNMWSRLPKSNKYKIESTEAFCLKALRGQALQSLTWHCKALYILRMPKWLEAFK